MEKLNLKNNLTPLIKTEYNNLKKFVFIESKKFISALITIVSSSQILLNDEVIHNKIFLKRAWIQLCIIYKNLLLQR